MALVICNHLSLIVYIQSNVVYDVSVDNMSIRFSVPVSVVSKRGVVKERTR